MFAPEHAAAKSLIHCAMMFFWNDEPAPLRSPDAHATDAAEPVAPLVGALDVSPPWESLPQADRTSVPAAASTRSRAPGHVLNVFPSMRLAGTPAGVATDGRQPRWTDGALEVNQA